MTLDNPFVQWLLQFVNLNTICMTWCLFSVGRVTEIAEEDTFLCESKVQEADRTVKRLGKGLKVREVTTSISSGPSAIVIIPQSLVT